MKRRPFLWLLTAASILLALSVPKTVLAEVKELIVDNNGGGDFATIQAAIRSAELNTDPTVSFFITVKSSNIPYTGPITLTKSIPIIGESTASTIITGGSPLISLSDTVASVDIRNFTFRDAATGILVTGSKDVKITNNVFELGGTATAVRVLNAPSTSVVNNTFFGNATAISTNSDIEISNNIFANNNLAIDDQVTLTRLTYSDFFQNGNNGVANLGQNSIPNTLQPDANPRFVSLAERDYHLQQDSPAKGSGNPKYLNSGESSSDMGAYGGPNRDRSLSAITGVTAREESESSNSITVSWNASSNSRVGAYRVYFGTSPRSVTGNSYPNSVLQPAPSTSTLLSNLPVTPQTAPGTPEQVTLTSLSGALQVNWTPVPGATGYRIYYRAEATFDQSTLASASVLNVPGGTSSSAVIPNLTNGTTYFVAVAARAQTQFFMAVTAVVNSGIASSPGSDNESPFSTEVAAGAGPAAESLISEPKPDFPEATSPYPDLANKGCFIATAAYGFYSAPQVQVLREFRDRFLMSSGPGRAFVAWYYRHGPRGAQFINDHPWLKPPVRLALLPLILLALFLTGVPPLTQGALAGCTLWGVIYLRRRFGTERRNGKLVPQRGEAQ